MNELLFKTINSLVGKSIWLDQLMVFSADWLGYMMILWLIIMLFRNRKDYINMVMIASVSAIFCRFVPVPLIRFLYHHQRPFEVLLNTHLLTLPWHISIAFGPEYSFPSGHASFYFALATGVYLYNKKAGRIYFTMAFLVGFARVFIGVHWPLDILAGAVLGIITSLITNRLYEYYIKDRLLRSRA